MELKRIYREWLTAGLLGLASCCALATEQVRLVAPFPAGGGLDALARTIADRLRNAVPAATFVVENKPGANGNLGAATVARAPADGNTLLVAHDAIVTVNPKLYKNAGFAPADLQPLGLLATQASVLVVPANSPITTVGQFIQESRKRELSYSSGGMGSAGHLTMSYLDSTVDTRHLHVPFTGGAPAIMALIGNQVDCAFLALPNALPQIKSGKLRALAVSSAERSASLPDVPTMAEAGHKGFEVVTAYMLMAPAKTPAEVRSKWSRALSDMAQAKDFQTRLTELGMEPKTMSADSTAAWLQAERKKWEAVITKHNISAE